MKAMAVAVILIAWIIILLVERKHCERLEHEVENLKKVLKDFRMGRRGLPKNLFSISHKFSEHQFNVRVWSFNAEIANYTRSDITLTTHLSLNRMHSLAHTLMVWKGPVSAAVFSEFQQNWTRILESLCFPVQFAVIVVVTPKKGPKQALLPYPINLLRNFAIKYSKTSQVLMLDVDYIPSFTADSIKSLLQSASLLNRVLSVYIIPAFDVRSSVIYSGALKCNHYSTCFSKLRVLVQQQNAFPSCWETWKPAYEPTNYSFWFQTSKAYKVSYQLWFEPFFIFDKWRIPWFFSDLPYTAMDKAGHSLELSLLNTTFWVLPQIFLYQAMNENRSYAEKIKAEFFEDARFAFNRHYLLYLTNRYQLEPQALDFAEFF
jgi:hypothetical protein